MYVGTVHTAVSLVTHFTVKMGVSVTKSGFPFLQLKGLSNENPSFFKCNGREAFNTCLLKSQCAIYITFLQRSSNIYLSKFIMKQKSFVTVPVKENFIA